MKTIFFLSLTALSSTVALAQNSAVINQQGTGHDVSVTQQGASNTAVINQSVGRSENRASVVQSGSGNTITINQEKAENSTINSQNSVNATQSGEGETIINQTNGGSSIHVYQSDSKRTNDKKKSGKKKTNE